MNVLFIADTEEDLLDLKRVLNGSCLEDNSFFVLSNSLTGTERVFELDCFVYLKMDINMYSDFHETYGIVDHLNEIIKGTNLREPWLFEMGYHIEYGYQQSINDYVAYLKLLIDVIRTNEILVAGCSADSNADLRNAYETLIDSGRIKSILPIKHGRRIMLKTTHAWKRLRFHYLALFSMSRVLNTIFCVGIRNRSKKKSNNKEVIFLSAFSDKKHFNWIIRTMNRVDESMSRHVFHFGDDSNDYMFEREGMGVTPVEVYFSLAGLFKSFLMVEDGYKRIEKELVRANSTYCEEIDIWDRIVKTYEEYVINEVLLDVARYDLLKRMLRRSKFRYVFIEGDSNYTINKALYYSAQNNCSIRIIKDDTFMPMLFQPFYEPFPYAHIIDAYIVPINFAYLYERIREDGFAGKIHIAGIKFDRRIIKSFENPERKRPKYLWAPSCPAIHYFDVESFVNLNETVFDFFEESRIPLRVKYHPGQEDTQIKSFLLRDNSLFFFYNKSDSIDISIDCSDVVLTSLSTVGMESIIKGKITLILIDGSEHRELDPMFRECLTIISAKDLPEYVLRIEKAFESDDNDGYISHLLEKQNRYCDYLECNGELSVFSRDFFENI